MVHNTIFIRTTMIMHIEYTSKTCPSSKIRFLDTMQEGSDSWYWISVHAGWWLEYIRTGLHGGMKI
jgi:hypothetical protein